jgi:hypothetical protein
MKNMKSLSPEMRTKLMTQRREIRRESESEFAFYFDAAKKAMPECAKEPLFEFIVRQLWEPYDGNVPLCWHEILPEMYASFCNRHSWSLTDSSVNISPTTGLQSLARLLCVLRKRERDLEGVIR